MNMHEHVKRYVAHKRSLGRKYVRQERRLLSWADAIMACGEDIIRADTMIRWAQQSSSNDEARSRLAIGRRFALWLRAEDERHEVPHTECLGRRQHQRRTPHLLSDIQIRTLMEAALQLPPAGSITPHTIHCIIGLVAVAGLRRAEACALQLSDVTEDGLVVRETKFGKSRLVPLSDSTRDALHRYLRLRKQLDAASDHLFVVSTGGPVTPSNLTHMFIKLARATGLRGGKGEPGVRLHDLRHRFAVRSLEQAIDADHDKVSRHILALSTYLGHVGVSSTYWYLHATPVLLQQIAETAEALHSGRASS
ncbi:MAG: tyrosine-type recombinase/integrase [Boseongicola sp. SB0664_bin_43]|uniref:Tyrosine-type recombinase/integrase n=1 Tax=Boseongicola sp. SB0664_bin_43 TaxID=2604844 RepID=A0A6B0Y145_9RHOB|nr:tyrosine-type recombinase/integrase [Boseongicola sp. SB0664_bin_43]MYK32939.1 tyrosine-type recombinase/integrase [Boseongicola sp. SB0670_bin_30]